MNYNKKSIEDIDIAGKRIIARCDFNVPQDKSGAITDDNRIVQALPTIKYMVEKGCKVVLCSHLGKPHNVFDKEIKLNKKEVAAISETLIANSKAVFEEVSLLIQNSLDGFNINIFVYWTRVKLILWRGICAILKNME